MGLLEGLKLQDDPGSPRAIVDSLKTLQGVAETLPREMCILRNLFFNSMYSREDGIKDAEAGTFKWILEEPADGAGGQDGEAVDSPTETKSERPGEPDPRAEATAQFSDWLTSDAEIFHISGKAGSGKSTLMKLICQDPSVKQRLETWAGSNRLIVSQYFFWHAGDDMQRSLHGLYRSILFDVLRQSPELIPLVFPEQWSLLAAGAADEPAVTASLFRLPKIKESFHTLIKKCSGANHAVCLFVDGLDEYYGDSMDHWGLAADLRTWSQQPNIKICVSSRPHTEFLAIFPKSSRIHLHAINAEDIEAYCRHEFEANQHLGRAPPDDLVDRIVSRSEGVFLWARLVVRSLLSSIGRFDTDETLALKLEEIPSDLDLLYDQILGSLDAVDRRRADRLLMLVLHNPFDLALNALMVDWLDELKDPNFPMPDKCRFYSMDEMSSRQERLRRQIYGITKGLVEVSEGNPKEGPFFQLQLQFFHRSVHAYLTEHRKLDSWDESLGGRVDAYARLRIAELLFARALDCYPRADVLGSLSKTVLPLADQLSAQTLRKFHIAMHNTGGGWRILPTVYFAKPSEEEEYHVPRLEEDDGLAFARFALSVGRPEFIAERIPDSTALASISAACPEITLFMTALTSCLLNEPLNTKSIDFLRSRGAWLDSRVQVLEKRAWDSLFAQGPLSPSGKTTGPAVPPNEAGAEDTNAATITRPRPHYHTVTAWSIFLTGFLDRASSYAAQRVATFLQVLYQSKVGPTLDRQRSLLRYLVEQKHHDDCPDAPPHDRRETVLLFSHNTEGVTNHLRAAPDAKIAWRECSFHVTDVAALMDAVPESRGGPTVWEEEEVRPSGLAHVPRRAGNGSSWGRRTPGGPLPGWVAERLADRGVVLDPLKLSALEDLGLAVQLVWVVTRVEAIRIRDFVYRVW